MAIHIDFETFSEADLKKVGAYKYAEHPSTEILCLAYNFEEDKEKTYLWTPECGEMPEDLFRAIEQGEIIFAHNAQFEFVIWNIVGQKKYNFPPLPLKILRCSAANAAAHAMPRNLGELAEALQVPIQKDKDGHRIMLQLSKPRKPTKNNPSTRHSDFEKYEKLYEYCEVDTLAEKACSKVVPQLSGYEQRVYALDQTINDRGIYCDVELCKVAIDFAETFQTKLLGELVDLTNGEVQTARQVAKFGNWLARQGVELPNLQAGTVEAALKDDKIKGKGRRALEIRQHLSKSSISKFEAMVRMACNDNRIRGTLLYHGASTGRWCTVGETEVLTNDGWVKIEKWNPENPIAVWSKNQKVEFELCGKHVFDFKGDLVCHDSKFNSFSVTPEHRVGYFTSRGNFSVKIASEIQNIRADIPTTGELQGPFEPKIKTKFFVMTQADGHYSSSRKGGNFLRFRFSKKRKIQRCKAILKQLGFVYSENKNVDGSIGIVVRKYNMAKWAWDFKAKTFGPFILKHNPKVFLSEVALWDGHRQKGCLSFEYSTCNETNAEWVQTMAHLAGHSARIVERPRVEKNWSTSFRVYVRPQNKHRASPNQYSARTFCGKVYCPSTSTGFFLMRNEGKISVTGNSGRGIQPQNFIRGSVKDLQTLFECLEQRDLELFEMLYENPMDALASSARGMLRAAPGHDLIAGDYAAIEARALFWLAGCHQGLEAFRKGEDIYKIMASKIFKIPVEKVTKAQRQLGKQAILGLGYGMGKPKFRDTCLNYNIKVSEQLAAHSVETYRGEFYQVPEFWKGVEAAAVKAVQTRQIIKYKNLKWGIKGRWLYCQLPSGRKLAYYDPKIKQVATQWGGKPTITFMGTNSVTRQWERQKTYGGKLVENVTQAVARDLMVNSMFELEKENYSIVLSVHDEVVCEIPKGFGSIEEYEEIMERLPQWAGDFPIKAEAWRDERFRK